MRHTRIFCCFFAVFLFAVGCVCAFGKEDGGVLGKGNGSVWTKGDGNTSDKWRGGLQFRHFDAKDGLAGSSVNCFLMSRAGYLWIGTENGAWRYDGSRFRRHCGGGLENCAVWAMQEDAAGDVWIEHSGGWEYARYDHAKDAVDGDVDGFLRERLGISVEGKRKIFVDRTGDIWVLTQKGVSRYSFAEGKARTCSTASLGDINYGELHVADVGKQLIVLQKNEPRLLALDKGTMKFKAVEISAGIMEKLADKPLKLYADERGVLWIYTLYGDYVYMRKPAEKRWQRVSLGASQPGQVNSIRCIASDGKGRVWIATDKRGLFAYNSAASSETKIPQNDDTADGAVENIVSDNAQTTSLLSNNVNTVMCDSAGNLWVGYYKKSMSVTNDAMSRRFMARGLQCGDVTSLLCDSRGTTWVGTDGNGLWATERLDNFARARHLLQGKTVTSICEDLRGRLWIGTYHNGIFCIDGGTTTNYTAENSPLPDNTVLALQTDRNGDIWVGMQNAHLAKMVLDERGLAEMQYGQYKVRGLCFAYDGGDTLYVGTYYGVQRIDIASEKMDRLVVGEDADGQFCRSGISALWLEGQARRLWIGHSPLLSVVDLRKGSLSVLSADDGLCDNNINSIMPTGDGRMLVATGKGLSHIAVSNGKEGLQFHIENFTTSIGIGNPHFNGHAATLLPDGDILLGTPDGCVEICAAMLADKASGSKSRVRLTGLMIGGQNVMPDSLYEGRVVIDRPIKQAGELRLTGDERQITFLFAQTEIVPTADTRYAYKIEGLHDEWLFTNDSQITINSLKPGRYTLLVRLAGDTGGQSAVSLPIVVALPFYRSPLAIALYALVLVAILSLLYIMSRRRKREAEAAKAESDLEKENAAAVDGNEIPVPQGETENAAPREVAPSEIAITSLDEQLLARAIEVVEQHIGDSDFSVEELGRILGLSRSHLYNKLTSLTGKSPAEFIRTLRVKRGRQLLDESGMQISEVAYAVGFSTPKRFSLNFKEEFGMMPSEYLKSKGKTADKQEKSSETSEKQGI